RDSGHHSYAVAVDAASRMGRALLQRGVRAGDRILLLVSRRARHRSHADGHVLEPPARGRTPDRVAVARRSAEWVADRRCHLDHDWTLADAIVKLVLFDIDGTILLTDGAGKRAIHRALTEVFGGTGPDDHPFGGKTDPQIVRELMRMEGHADSHI